MDCPACARSLSRKTVADVTVEVCEGGCGGVWFDRLELEKVDEARESAGAALLDVLRDADARPDRGESSRACPRCGDMVMHRHFFTVKREIEVDECPGCGGVWLDAGELARLRAQFETEEARDEAAAEEYRRRFGEQLEAIRAESREEVERARSFARTMRFVLPSYWIPGDQDWGAF